MTLETLINGIRKFAAALENGSLITASVNRHEREIVALNTEKQLFQEGENAMGVTIRSYKPYSPVTISIKKKKGQPTNRVTLRDTEAFHKSFFILADGRAIWFKARDKKAEKLYEKYGEIFGLTTENTNFVAWSMLYNELRDDLITSIKNG